MFDDDFPPLPSLLPFFTIVGALASTFSVLCVGAFNPSACDARVDIALALGASVGGALGLILSRWRALRNPMAGPELLWIRLAVLNALAGAAIGGAVTWVSYENMGQMKESIALGAVFGLLFVPGCRKVVDAAQRSVRARLGSIVAESDRRSVWTALVFVGALAVMVGAPSIATGACHYDLGVLAQGGILFATAAAGLGASVWLAARERRALDDVVAIAREATTLESARDEDPEAPEVRDLGLGDERFAREVRGLPYRGKREATVALLGEPSAAVAALRASALERRRTLAVCAISTVVVTGAAAAQAIAHYAPIPY
jgi:hypothetical protein